jgi:hypothetical protein
MGEREREREREGEREGERAWITLFPSLPLSPFFPFSSRERERMVEDFKPSLLKVHFYFFFFSFSTSHALLHAAPSHVVLIFFFF